MSSDEPALIDSRAAAEDLKAPPGRPLAIRLAAFFLLTSLLLVTISSGILYWATVAALKEADDQVVQKRMEAILEILREKELDVGEVAHEVSEDNQGPRQIFIRIVTPYKALQLETPTMDVKLPPSVFPDVSNSEYMDDHRATVTTAKHETYRTLAIRVPVAAKPGPDEAFIQVATDTTLDEEGLRLFRRILALVLGAAVPLCGAASWFLVKRELRPLDRIAHGAEMIDSATLNQRLAVAGLPDELHGVATRFNQMLDRLETTCNGLKQYADNIAHELRTPINRMRLQSELALRHPTTPEAYEAAIAANVEECETLTRLLHGLLFLARAENRQTTVAPEAFALDGVFNAIQDYFEAAAEVKGIRLVTSAETGLQVSGDRVLIQRAIANLVSNALAHTPGGGKIFVTAKRQAGHARIAVTDTGEGIASEHYERLFDRFYRAGQASSAQSDRLGLGLAIAKGIVDLHGGTITVDSTLGKGTTFTMLFPAAAAVPTSKADAS